MAKSATKRTNKLDTTQKILRKKISKSAETSRPSTRNKKIEDRDVVKLSKETEQFIQKVRTVFKKLNKKNPSAENHKEQYIEEKLCEKCFLPEKENLLLLCDVCDDAYHTYCLDRPLKRLPKKDDDWVCPPCMKLHRKKEAEEKKMRQSKLEEHFLVTKRSKSKTCHQCQKDLKHPPDAKKSEKKPEKKQKIKESKEVCVKCQHVYHSVCFNTRKGAILCHTCEEVVRSATPKSSKTLYEFFCVKTKLPITQAQKNVKESKDSMEEEGNSQSTRDEEETQAAELKRLESPLRTKKRVKKGTKRLILKKQKKPFFRLPKLLEDEEALLHQKTLFAKALISKNLTFDDDLCFSNPDCPPEANDASLEPNLQKMDEPTLRVFQKFKEMSRKGDYAPVNVIEDKLQGFVVQAMEDIPKYTLISEYVGEVDYARNRLYDSNDSIMDLLRTTRSATSLVICPESRGNLARFLSGINNHKSTAKNKLNVTILRVRSIRFNVEGHVRVMLYADRNIKKGELLYYDYNAGGFNEYPTEDFV